MSHLVAAVGFGALAGAILYWRKPNTLYASVGVASFLTAAWAGLLVIIAWQGLRGWGNYLLQLETLRTTAWIGVLILMQRRILGLGDRLSSTFGVLGGLGLVIILQVVLGFAIDKGDIGKPLQGQWLLTLFIGTRLAVAISGLVLLHNMYVNSRDAEDMYFRIFAVCLGMIFAYDLNMFTLFFLLGEPNVPLLEMRGVVNALTVPLFVMALRQGHRRPFQPSRKAAFHTISFTIIGSYLIMMSLLAYALRLTGGSWGELLQIAFLVVALMAGALIVLSPRFRAELKVRISRNFYRYRYDYRVEWLRFIDTLHATSEDVPDQLPIRERLVQAIAAVLHCPGGVLLEQSEAGGYELLARWRWEDLEMPMLPEDATFIRYLAETGRIVDFDALRLEAVGRSEAETRSAHPRAGHGNLTCPDWALADSSIWVGVPLIHRDRLMGILLLQRSLAARELNWEDFDLLRTLGRQGASYLAEAATQARLDEARSFDEFNRRFAFVMHDLKNVVSQLALLSRNAERHADKPEFRTDMVETLKLSVTKMTDLMQLLGREIAKTDGDATKPGNDMVDFARLVATIVATFRRGRGAIHFAEMTRPVMVAGDAGRLEAMVTHLIQNAIDASDSSSPIMIGLEESQALVRLQVEDRGEGMSAAFIRNGLFKPFRSTKEGGFGIGAFEAREIVRAHGGRMEVRSKLGEGTRFQVYLPLCEEDVASMEYEKKAS